MLKRLIVAVEAATTANAVIGVDETGRLYGPVDGLHIVSLADEVLGRGSQLHTDFVSHWRTLERREALKHMIEAAEIIAERLNTWGVIEGGADGRRLRHFPVVSLPPFSLPTPRTIDVA